MIRLIATILYLIWGTEAAHAGFLVPFVLAALEISLPALAVSALVFVVNVAAAYGLSYVAGKLLAKDEEGAPQEVGGAELDLRADAKIPQSLIFGRAVTAGSLVYAATFGRAPGSGAYATIHNNELIEIIALADHPVEGLVDTYIEGQPVTLAAPSGDRGQEVTSSGYVTPTTAQKLLALKFYDGSQTTADAFTVTRLGTVPNQPWTSAMVGTGITYVRLHYVYKADQVPGRLRWKFVIDGIKLYDPRLDTTVGGVGPHRYDQLATHEWTDNLAVILYNVLRGIYVANSASVRQFFYGLENTTADQFPLDVWFAAMNECDVSMDLGGTSSEPQYRVGGEVGVDVEPLELVQALVKSCGGRLVEVGGIYKLYLGAPGLSVATITDGDLRADQEDSFRPILGLQNRINYITGAYTSPGDGWVEKVAPDRKNATWETEDGRRLPADLNVPLVQSARQVQQLMEQLLMRSRQQRKHVVPLGRAGFAIEPGDVVTLNSDRNGYTAKLFEVDDADYDPDLNTTLSITEVDPADYDWVSAQQIPEVPGEIVSNPPDAKTVVGFAATGVEWLSEHGYKRPAIKLQWTVPSEDLDISAVLWELRVAANPTNVTSGQILDVQAGSGLISAGVISNTQYEVRAMYASNANFQSSWSLWIPVTTPDTKLTQEETDIILDTALLEGLPALAQLVDEHSALILQQNDALLGVQDQADSASASSTFRVIAVTTPDEALAAIEMQVRSIVGANFASAGIQLVSYADTDGTETSRIRMYGDYLQFGFPGETGGDFVNVVEIANRAGVPTVVIRGELYKDNAVGVDTLIEGAAATVMTRSVGATDDVSHTFTDWNNGGAGEVAATIVVALDGDGPVAVDWSCNILDSQVSNSSDEWILELNGVEVWREFFRGGSSSTIRTHEQFFYTITAGTLTGTNQLQVKYLHGTTGAQTSALSKIQWRVIEYHKPAVQAGGAVAAAVTYRTAQSALNVNTMTVSGVSTGTAAANRRVIVGIGYQSSTANTKDVTINGITAERVSHKRSANMVAQLWAATVPLLTSADVVISTTGVLNELTAAVWTITTMAEAYVDEVGDIAEAGGSPLIAENVEIQNGGVAIAFAWGRNTSAFAGAWSGVDAVTEAVEAAGASTTRYAGYHFLTTESTVDDDFTFTHGASANAHALVIASWR